MIHFYLCGVLWAFVAILFWFLITSRGHKVVLDTLKEKKPIASLVLMIILVPLLSWVFVIITLLEIFLTIKAKKIK